MKQWLLESFYICVSNDSSTLGAAVVHGPDEPVRQCMEAALQAAKQEEAFRRQKDADALSARIQQQARPNPSYPSQPSNASVSVKRHCPRLRLDLC